MSSSGRHISWNLQRGCCTVKELSQFKPFSSKTSSLDGFHMLSLGLLFWQLSLPRDPHFASLTVSNTGPAFRGPVGHLSLPRCVAAGPECVFSSHHFPLKYWPPWAVGLWNETAGTICSVLVVLPVLASSAAQREETTVIQIPQGWRTERKEKMLGWETEGWALEGEEGKTVKSQRLFKRKKGKEEEGGNRTRKGGKSWFISSEWESVTKGGSEDRENADNYLFGFKKSWMAWTILLWKYCCLVLLRFCGRCYQWKVLFFRNIVLQLTGYLDLELVNSEQECFICIFCLVLFLFYQLLHLWREISCALLQMPVIFPRGTTFL